MIGGAAARVGPWSAAAVTIALSLAAAGVAGTGPGSAGLQGVGLKLLVMPVLWAVPGALIAAHGTAVGIVSPAGGVLAHRDTDLLPADEGRHAGPLLEALDSALSDVDIAPADL